jgi:hypothetical protein
MPQPYRTTGNAQLQQVKHILRDWKHPRTGLEVNRVGNFKLYQRDAGDREKEKS